MEVELIPQFNNDPQLFYQSKKKKKSIRISYLKCLNNPLPTLSWALEYLNQL